jgi:hypothetical protein
MAAPRETRARPEYLAETAKHEASHVVRNSGVFADISDSILAMIPNSSRKWDNVNTISQRSPRTPEMPGLQGFYGFKPHVVDNVLRNKSRWAIRPAISRG